MTLVGLASITIAVSLSVLLKKNIAWIVSLFQGTIPCLVYFTIKDYVPLIIEATLLFALFAYSYGFLRPFFSRRFREWTDIEFILYFLLMLLLCALVFILFEVFESGLELFCSV